MATSPAVLYEDLPDEIPEFDGDKPSYRQVSRRMRVLRENGVLEQHPERSSLYRLSDLGRRYLDDPDADVDEFLQEDEDDEDDEDGEDGE